MAELPFLGMLDHTDFTQHVFIKELQQGTFGHQGPRVSRCCIISTRFTWARPTIWPNMYICMYICRVIFVGSSPPCDTGILSTYHAYNYMVHLPTQEALLTRKVSRAESTCSVDGLTPCTEYGVVVYTYKHTYMQSTWYCQECMHVVVRNGRRDAR